MPIKSTLVDFCDGQVQTTGAGHLKNTHFPITNNRYKIRLTSYSSDR